MSQKNITCVVTLHGIGFEQPPSPEIENSGYADQLHQHLKLYLDSRLSDDPRRQRRMPGTNGAIYVQSRWLDEEGNSSSEAGLQRLGNWAPSITGIDLRDAPLVDDTATICHIALVYSNLEPLGPELGAAARLLEMAAISSTHYASVLGLVHKALEDGVAVLTHRPKGQAPVSLQPRSDLPGAVHSPATNATGGLPSILLNLADDVACYVCYNEVRERVRSFVREALTRLAQRDDVKSIVLNTHSNGSVIAFDVVRGLHPHTTHKIKALITAGSPLRKYVDLFHWGSQIQSLTAIEPWYNFWDKYDPVGDPQEKLFQRIDLGNETLCPMKVIDTEVHDLEKSQGGGLQAHNYWDNKEEFVQRLASIVTDVANQQPRHAA